MIHFTDQYSVTTVILTGCLWPLCRQSQSPAWVEGFGSQSAQAAAPPGQVMSNLANFSMAGYQTQWAGPNISAVPRGCCQPFLKPHGTLSIWTPAVGEEGQGPYSQSLCRHELLPNNQFKNCVYIVGFHFKFLNVYLLIITNSKCTGVPELELNTTTAFVKINVKGHPSITKNV